jgi:hypothetical protein
MDNPISYQWNGEGLPRCQPNHSSIHVHVCTVSRLKKILSILQCLPRAVHEVSVSWAILGDRSSVGCESIGTGVQIDSPRRNMMNNRRTHTILGGKHCIFQTRVGHHVIFERFELGILSQSGQCHNQIRYWDHKPHTIGKNTAYSKPE